MGTGVRWINRPLGGVDLRAHFVVFNQVQLVGLLDCGDDNVQISG